MKRIFLTVSSALAALMIGASAFAGESVFARRIVSIGCHNFDGVCFVTLDGAPFGSNLGCSTARNDFRFENAATEDGKRTYASLLAGHIAGKPVTVQLDGCTSEGVPKLIWFHVL